MADLLRIETERVVVTLTGPPPPDHTDHTGRLSLRLLSPTARLVGDQARYGVPAEAAADMSETAGPVLFEETTYTLLVEAKDGGNVEVSHRYPGILNRLNAAQKGRICHGPINFRSQVGTSRFIVATGGSRELQFEVEVFPSKLDYKADYAAIVADIQGILTALALEYLRATHQGALPEPSGENSQLEWVLLLRHLADDLTRALRYIQQHPIRSLSRHPELVRVERIRRHDSGIRRAVLKNRGVGPTVRIRSGLPVRSYLHERQATPTLDTPEHRWIARSLDRILSRLSTAAEEVTARISHARRQGQEPSVTDTAVLRELEGIESQLSPLREIEPVKAAEGFPPPDFISLQLQGAPGYRETLQCCLLLAHGLRVTGGPTELSLKDVHLLYEYWCFLATLRAVADVLGETIPPEALLTVERDGLRVDLKRGREHTVPFPRKKGRAVSVTYSPQFKGEDYLLPQQPDIVITLRNEGWPTVRLVLDAKYRLDVSTRYVEQMGSPGPPQDAINVLHRYRDAILEREPHGSASRTVIEGAALFPFHPAEGTDFRESRLWSSLERLGIGAIPLLPGEEELLQGWISSVLRRAGWDLADVVPPVALHRAREDWRFAAAEPVLVGVLRHPGESEHLEWIKTASLYYAPRTPTQPLQYRARWLAVYESARVRGQGAVTRVFEILDVDVVERDEIPTPWQSSRVAQLQVLYRLGPGRELENPIVNIGQDGTGQRVSHNRWTSRLALERATSLPELLLETEPEWRLYDALVMSGMDARLIPTTPGLKDPENPKGRTWIETEYGRALYRGMGGWLIATPQGDRLTRPNVETVLEYLG